MHRSKLCGFVVVIILLMGTNLTSQEASTSKFALGIGRVYNFDYEDFGLNFHGVYTLSDNIRLAPAFNYYFIEGDVVKIYTFDLDGHYLLSETASARFYGLVGLNIAVVSVDLDVPVVGDIFSESTTDIGINAGAGGQYPFSDKLGGFGELKYIIGDQSGFVLTAGLRYSF